MDINIWNNWYIILSVIFVGGSILYAVHKYALSKVYAMIKQAILNSLTNDVVKRVTDAVSAEFKVNGGKTMKDQLDRIEKNQKETSNALPRIEEVLYKQVGLNRAVLNQSQIAFWESDANGKCVVVGRALCNLLGRSEPEMLGNNWSVWLHPDDKDRVIDEWASSIKQKTDFKLSYRFVKPNRKIIYVDAEAYGLMNNKGELMGYYGVLKEKESN